MRANFIVAMTSIALLGCDQAGALQFSGISDIEITPFLQTNSGDTETKEVDAALEL